MTRASRITEEAVSEKEIDHSVRVYALFLQLHWVLAVVIHHTVPLLPLPPLNCILSMLTTTPSRQDLFLSIFGELVEQRGPNHITRYYCKRNKR